jgi:hypothetical protein
MNYEFLDEIISRDTKNKEAKVWRVIQTNILSDTEQREERTGARVPLRRQSIFFFAEREMMNMD